jgi:hypothetical protein
MLCNHSQMCWRWAAVLVLSCLLCSTSTARAQQSADGGASLLDSVKRKNEVAAQKAEADVREAIRDAQRLVAISAGKAVERLQKALDQVESDTVLSEKRRHSLVGMLKDRIRVAQAAPASVEDSFDKQIDKNKRRAEEDLRLTDQDRMKRLLDGIRKLQREGKTEEAAKQAGELAKSNPSSPVAQAAGRTASTANQVAANRQLQSDKERATAGVLGQVDKSGLAPKDDITYPKDWKQRTKDRKASTVVLTAKEKALFRALNSIVSVRFKDTRLEDAIEYLQTTTGLTILLDKVAMEEAGVSYDSPVSVNVKGVTARFVLRKIMADLGLAYVIKDETIEVVTPKQFQEMMVVRTYNVLDLVIDPARPWLELVNAAMLIDLIQTTIEPGSWKANGGQGTIVYHQLTHSLVIKQSAEFHGTLSGGLR